MRKYLVRVQKGGNVKQVEVEAPSQKDAKVMAEAQNPGYQAKGCQSA